MPEPTDPAGLVRKILNSVGPNAKEFPDPFDDDITALTHRGHCALPVRLRGLLAQQAEEEREIARDLEQQRGTATQDFISRRLHNTTAYDSNLRNLNRKEEADRSTLRERWYCGLSIEDKAAFDDLCLTIVKSINPTSFPPFLPACLLEPMGRLLFFLPSSTPPSSVALMPNGVGVKRLLLIAGWETVALWTRSSAGSRTPKRKPSRD